MRRPFLLAALAVSLACGSKPPAFPPRTTPSSKSTRLLPAFDVEVVDAQPGAAIEGVVRDRTTGAALTGATITASSPSVSGYKIATSDERGRFALPSLPPGSYELMVFYGDGGTTGKVDVAAGKLTRIAFAV